jgi:hypothetical protein
LRCGRDSTAPAHNFQRCRSALQESFSRDFISPAELCRFNDGGKVEGHRIDGERLDPAGRGNTAETDHEFHDRFILRYAFSHDDKQLALAQGNFTSDIVLIKDFR